MLLYVKDPTIIDPKALRLLDTNLVKPLTFRVITP